MNYTATKWNTAEDKAKFEKAFKRFVEQGFPERLFTKAMYQRMSNMRGHIAHYNKGGFYEAHFYTHLLRAEFLRRWTNHWICGDPVFTWSDVEHVLADWLKEHPEYEAREMQAHAAELEKAERAELSRLTAKYGAVAGKE